MKYPKRLPILQFVLFLLVLRSSDANETPKTFGLTTVTHTRGGSIEQFQIYLKRYAELDCPIISQINVVWNNQQSMEELGVFQTKHLWKRPIYFYKTPNNAMDWRYKLAPQSKAEVYFSIDDDIIVGCDELTKSFDQWRKAAVGSIGPLVSYGPRHFTYDKDRGMAYGDPGYNGQFYALSLTGLCFISRLFLNLYYADTFQISQIRKVVRQYNNCDDIALNYIVSYYFPELLSISVMGDLKITSPKIGQSATQAHFVYRNKCIKQFSCILGVNPQRYLPVIDAYPGKYKRISVLRDAIVQQKSAYIQKFIIPKQSQKNSQSSDSLFYQKISELQKSLNAAFQQINQKQNEVSALQKILGINVQQQSQSKIDEEQNKRRIRLTIELAMAIGILVLSIYIFIIKIKRLTTKQVFHEVQSQFQGQKNIDDVQNKQNEQQNTKQVAQNNQRQENQKIKEEVA